MTPSFLLLMNFRIIVTRINDFRSTWVGEMRGGKLLLYINCNSFRSISPLFEVSLWCEELIWVWYSFHWMTRRLLILVMRQVHFKYCRKNTIFWERFLYIHLSVDGFDAVSRQRPPPCQPGQYNWGNVFDWIILPCASFVPFHHVSWWNGAFPEWDLISCVQACPTLAMVDLELMPVVGPS